MNAHQKKTGRTLTLPPVFGSALAHSPHSGSHLFWDVKCCATGVSVSLIAFGAALANSRAHTHTHTRRLCLLEWNYESGAQNTHTHTRNTHKFTHLLLRLTM